MFTEEQEELDVLIKRIKIELHSGNYDEIYFFVVHSSPLLQSIFHYFLDSKGVSTRSGKHALKRLDQDPTDDTATSLQNSQIVDESTMKLKYNFVFVFLSELVSQPVELFSRKTSK